MELGILKQTWAGGGGRQKATGAYSFRTEKLFRTAWWAPAFWPEIPPKGRTSVIIRLNTLPVLAVPAPRQVLLHVSISPFVDTLTFSRNLYAAAEGYCHVFSYSFLAAFKVFHRLSGFMDKSSTGDPNRSQLGYSNIKVCLDAQP